MVRLLLLAVALFTMFPKTTALLLGVGALICGIATHALLFTVVAVVCLVPLLTWDLN